MTRERSLGRSCNDLRCRCQSVHASNALSLPLAAGKGISLSFPCIAVPGTPGDKEKVEMDKSTSHPSFQLHAEKEDAAQKQTLDVKAQENFPRFLVRTPHSWSDRFYTNKSLSHKSSQFTQKDKSCRVSPIPLTSMEIEDIKRVSAASPAVRPQRRPQILDAFSFTSLNPLVEERDAIKKRTAVSIIPPTSSPAQRRKFEEAEKTFRRARKLVEDFRRSIPFVADKRFVAQSLAEALEEVKDCRYLRVIKKS